MRLKAELPENRGSIPAEAKIFLFVTVSRPPGLLSKWNRRQGVRDLRLLSVKWHSSEHICEICDVMYIYSCDIMAESLSSGKIRGGRCQATVSTNDTMFSMSSVPFYMLSAPRLHNEKQRACIYCT